MPIRTITEREFEQEVLRNPLPVLIEFTAEWCAPCKTIAPEVEALAREVEGKASVFKVDIDRSPLVARQLRVQSVPMFVVFVEGRPVDAAVGAIGRKQMRALIDRFLPRPEGAIRPLELAQLLKEGKVIPIDTREASAYERAHLPKARHLPIDEIDKRLAELHMVPGEPVLYCRAGDKTKELADRLAEQSLPILFLEGGLLAWEAEGLPIERKGS